MFNNLYLIIKSFSYSFIYNVDIVTNEEISLNTKKKLVQLLIKYMQKRA